MEQIKDRASGEVGVCEAEARGGRAGGGGVREWVEHIKKVKHMKQVDMVEEVVTKT